MGRKNIFINREIIKKASKEVLNNGCYLRPPEVNPTEDDRISKLRRKLAELKDKIREKDEFPT